MTIKKFFILDNYKNRLKLYYKKLEIKRLEKLKFNSCGMSYIWQVGTAQNFNLHFSDELCYSIFGIKINLEDIEWHKDKFSGFVYTLKRFDKLNAEQWFDQGIELKFPWELSRFYFAISLGQKYLITKDESYYKIFKTIVLKWIEKNPFLYGVNWLSTMEVAIRLINWIVATNIFSELIKNDKEFKKIITQSLLQHAEYIHSFPEIYEKELTTNHTTAGYAGLLFLALSFQDHIKSKIWMESAVNGLENCIKEQVYEDGVDFEASIPYHRLVLELFAYSAMVADSNHIKFSNEYYKKLFKMFEFTAAYIDENGNAPQIGDNDSGRLLIFNALDNDPYKNEHDHSYLLSLGENIFDYKFRSKCMNRDEQIISFLFLSAKIKTGDLSIKPRDTEKSISFEKGGIYLLKNRNFDLLVSLCPPGQKGKGGHNHLDAGSFTLSVKGNPIIVDPGTYCYSTNKIMRDKFRSHAYHNTLFTELDEKIDLNENGLWGLKKYYESEILEFNDDAVSLQIIFNNDEIKKRRIFELKEDYLTIKDECKGEFTLRINFSPNIAVKEIEKGKFHIGDIIIKTTSNQYTIEDYEYSPHYGSIIKSKCIKFFSIDNLEIKIAGATV